MPMSPYDMDAVRNVVVRHRSGGKVTEVEARGLLDTVSYWLGLDDMGKPIRKFTKSKAGSTAVYEFHFDADSASVRGFNNLCSEAHVLGKLSETLDAIICVRDNANCSPVVSWPTVVHALLAAIDPAATLKDFENKDVVRQWVREHFQQGIIFGKWALSQKNHRPFWDDKSEWVWFHPCSIADDKGLTGNDRKQFYETLRSIGVKYKSIKVDDKVHKAYRFRWRDFFADVADLDAYLLGPTPK